MVTLKKWLCQGVGEGLQVINIDERLRLKTIEFNSRDLKGRPVLLDHLSTLSYRCNQWLVCTVLGALGTDRIQSHLRGLPLPFQAAPVLSPSLEWILSILPCTHSFSLTHTLTLCRARVSQTSLNTSLLLVLPVPPLLHSALRSASLLH